MRNLKSNPAFTLIEIITVVVILSVIVILAVPNYLIILEKFRAEEGKQMLYAIYAANKQCQIDNPASSWCNWLGGGPIELRTSKYFPLSRVTYGESWPGHLYLGMVMRMDNNDTVQLYTLRIKSNGGIVCWDGSTPPTTFPGICAKIGIPYDP